MNNNYYIPSGPLHEHNRLLSSPISSSSDYIIYDTLTADYHTEKSTKKTLTKSKHHQQQYQNRGKTLNSKSKTQITEREAKEAIIKGLVTETEDVDVTKLSGK